jgi:hypothetical protein
MDDIKKDFLNHIKIWMQSIILLPITIYFALNSSKFHFIDYVNLLIHEGGHGIFSFFGKFIYTLGGTLAQILIPGMFVIYYYVVQKKILFQVFLVWLGQNFINISIYTADARARKRPLLGGKKVYHDWTYILNELGLILYDKEVGMLFYSLGLISFFLALVAPLFLKPISLSRINLDL